MTSFEVAQLTDGEYQHDLHFPLNLRPSISDDGSRVVFASKIQPGIQGYSTCLYDKDIDDQPRRLSVHVHGAERLLASSRPQISGDGRSIVFAARFRYTEEQETGIYIYDIESGTIRRVVDDRIPRGPTGMALEGAPGLRKNETRMPSISSDGRWLAYVWTDYEYSGATRYYWTPVRQRLMLAGIRDDGVSGGTVLEIKNENTFGYGIQSLKISGDGHHIAFYAGGVVEGLGVSNLEMPAYEAVTHHERASPTCDVHCYVVHVHQGTGSYTLEVVPKPDAPERPLIVAHPQHGNVQSFNVGAVLGNPPSICANGSRIALNAGFAMGSEKTGIYVYEPFGLHPGTNEIICFGARPGVGPGEHPLTTGALPAISADGKWLAHYRRDVCFREGYGDPDEYEEGETYCPHVLRDEVQVRRIPGGTISDLIETADDPVCPVYTWAMGMAIARDASHVAFISRANKVDRNADQSHEVYYATRLSPMRSAARIEGHRV